MTDRETAERLVAYHARRCALLDLAHARRVFDHLYFAEAIRRGGSIERAAEIAGADRAVFFRTMRPFLDKAATE